LKKENEELNYNLNETENKYSNILQHFEQQILEMSKKSDFELDYFNKLKQDKAVINEHQEKDIRDMRNEIKSRDIIIANLKTENQNVNSSMKNYGNKFESELSTRDNVIRAKDREISELHSLLEKSYSSGHDRLKNNINVMNN